jgi:secondary thiamine-phosphate synthase enzyme
MASVHSSSFVVKTDGSTDVHNITEQVNELLRHSPLVRGIATVFVPGSTAGITTIEYETGAVEDLKKAIERLAPKNLHYDHDARWGDGNGFSHVRAALLGPSLALPFSDHKLQLGTWQQVILVEFDNRPRTRDILVQLVGE